MTIRVLIADDHPLFREGLRSLFSSESGVEVIAEAADGEEAIAKTLALRPDVVVMDLMMPNVNGVDATRRICAECPDTKVLVLSMYDDTEHVERLLASGASGYLLKRATSEELVRALRSVAAGEMPLDPSVAATVVKAMLRREEADEEPASESELTPRELEVLTLIADGSTNQAIADRFGLSRKTVDVHRANVMRKLGLAGVTELVKYALRRGLISLDKSPG